VKAPARVEAVINKVRALAIQNNIDPDLIERIYRTVIDSFINYEMKEHIDMSIPLIWRGGYITYYSHLINNKKLQKTVLD
jgi:hypothetical protein